MEIGIHVFEGRDKDVAERDDLEPSMSIIS